jgi:hypothetical protein
MAHELLGGEDAAWLRMEESTNPMIVNGVLELAAPLALADAFVLLARLASIPRFRARVAPPAMLGRPSWQGVDDFDITQHVERVELAEKGEAALRSFIAGAVGGLLDPRRPLWHAYVIDRPGAGTTILCRVHHCLGDGFALLGVLLSLCDQAALGRVNVPRAASRGALRSSAKALWRMVTLPPDRRTLLKGPLGTEKRVAWTDPVALTSIKEVARRSMATVNDVLVAVTAGALGRYLSRRGDATEGLELHAMVPVNLRSAGPSDLGNRFGLVLLGLPIGLDEPEVRVGAVKQRMKLLKATPEALVAHALLRAMGWAPRAIEDLAVTFFGKKTSLVLTNVPGPRTRLTLGGIDVSRIMFWVPQAARMGLGISIFSYAGEVTIGVLSDAGLVPDPETLVADMHAELFALGARGGEDAEGQVAPRPAVAVAVDGAPAAEPSSLLVR